MNKTTTQLHSRNDAVRKAYLALLKLTNQLLSTVEQEELRYTLVREDKRVSAGYIVHEQVNPLLYIRLEQYADDRLHIHYGFSTFADCSNITSSFCRSVYRLTSKEVTPVNIEDCIHTGKFIHNPDEMYEYVEEQNKYHTFKQIKYKHAASRRKQMKAVA